MPFPARVLRLLWGEYDVREFNDNLECPGLQRDLIVRDIQVPAVILPRIWSAGNASFPDTIDSLFAFKPATI